MKLSIAKKTGTKNENLLSSLLHERFWDPYSFFESPLLTKFEKEWAPKIDVSETEKEMKIKVNIPNVDPNKITVEVDEDTLIISGKTEEEKKEEGETFYKIEREEGEFKRVCWLPSSVDIDKIEANSKNGTLFITIPKKAQTSKKRIPIKM